jgi:serine/threonine-protein kinase
MITIEGYSKEEAEKMLAEIGLTMEVIGYMTSDEYPLPGYVAYQERKAGFEPKKGDSVKVKLSQGGEKVLVPDVSQLSSTLAAKMQIEQNGDLIYVEEYEFHDVKASGEIIRQEPKANDKVDKGTEVIVFISKGPASGDSGLVVVPNLIGRTEQEAREILDASKLIAKVEYTKSASKADGIVLTQTPEENEYQTELAEVVLIVNRLTDGPVGEDQPNKEPSKPTLETAGKRKVTIDLSTVGERDNFNVKVVLEGNAVGKRIEYEKTHSREDGKIEVFVTDVTNTMLKVYIDDVVKYEMTL